MLLTNNTGLFIRFANFPSLVSVNIVSCSSACSDVLVEKGYAKSHLYKMFLCGPTTLSANVYVGKGNTFVIFIIAKPHQDVVCTKMRLIRRLITRSFKFNRKIIHDQYYSWGEL